MLGIRYESLEASTVKKMGNQKNLYNLTEKPCYIKCNSQTKRLQKSPIPYLTDLLNKYNGHK